jgi:hypothetical protein
MENRRGASDRYSLLATRCSDTEASADMPASWRMETTPRRRMRIAWSAACPMPMGVRRQIVEPPFGTLKARMGNTHFLTKTLQALGVARLR